MSEPSEGFYDDVCAYCGGYGEIFGHAPDCYNDDCALACGIDDCLGQVDPCPVCDSDRSGEAVETTGSTEGESADPKGIAQTSLGDSA